jgi:hypothetical protein
MRRILENPLRDAGIRDTLRRQVGETQALAEREWLVEICEKSLTFIEN